MQTLCLALTEALKQASAHSLNSFKGTAFKASIESLKVFPLQAEQVVEWQGKAFKAEVRLEADVSVFIHFDRHSQSVDKLIFSLCQKPLTLHFQGDGEVVYSGKGVVRDISHHSQKTGSQSLKVAFEFDLRGLVQTTLPLRVKSINLY